jgi:hypothetical protein
MYVAEGVLQGVLYVPRRQTAFAERAPKRKIRVLVGHNGIEHDYEPLLFLLFVYRYSSRRRS